MTTFVHLHPDLAGQQVLHEAGFQEIQLRKMQVFPFHSFHHHDEAFYNSFLLGLFRLGEMC